MNGSKPIILVDGSSYFFRAFHALPPLITAQGQPTGAIYGVINMIKRLLKDHDPDLIGVIFDAPGKNFRHDWYPDYKSHRKETPADLKKQYDPLVDCLKALGLFVIAIDGVEADDVIGTLTQMAKNKGHAVLISTSDKDMAQLVDSQVHLINTMNNQRLDEAGVKEKFGVIPSQMIDYLSLVGDTSDNVPGVPKCGPKTAAKWLEQYKTIETLIAHQHEITGKIGDALRAFIPQLDQSKRLVTIETHLSLPFDLDALRRQPEDSDRLKYWAQTLEFKAWFKEHPEWTTEKKPICSHIATLNEWNQSIAAHALSETMSFTLSVQEKTLVAIECCFDGVTAYRFASADASLMRSAITALEPIVHNPNCLKIGFDLKKNWSLFKTYQWLIHPYHDLMLAAYVLNSTQPSTQEYAHEGGSALIWQTYHQITGAFTPALKAIYLTLEMPLLAILAEMEALGVRVDPIELARQGKHLSTHLAALEQQAFALAGRTFNLNSPKQLLEILYQDQQLPILSKTPTGQPSTSEAVLQTLAETYPLPAIILAYRSTAKLLSTYIEALPKHIHPLSERIHTTFNQALTSTGRLSSSDPNLQNIPIRHPEGRAIRRAFVAPEGFTLLTADYSQIELRIMAHLSNDPSLKQAFINHLDVHAATASELFHVPLEAVTTEQRRRAKAINFGLIYGMSSFGLSKQLKISPKEAQYYIDYYFERYPGVLTFMNETREKARTFGYVETLFGRILYIPNIHSSQKIQQKAAERMAINAPLQGTAADLIKKAMIDIHHWIVRSESIETVRLVLQVHDELIFEVQTDSIVSVQTTIQALMEQVMTLSVPLCVSVGTGPNWDLAH